MIKKNIEEMMKFWDLEHNKFLIKKNKLLEECFLKGDKKRYFKELSILMSSFQDKIEAKSPTLVEDIRNFYNFKK